MSVRTWRCFRPKMSKKSSRDCLERLWQRRSGICEYCHRKTEMPPRGKDREPGVLYASRDHKVPLALGGQNFDGNYALACEPCNNLKGDRDWPKWERFMAKNPRWWESMARKPKPTGEVQQTRDQVGADVDYGDGHDCPDDDTENLADDRNSERICDPRHQQPQDGINGGQNDQPDQKANEPSERKAHRSDLRGVGA